MILFYITCKDDKEAKKIGKHLLDNGLIACANYFPIRNMYWWSGEVTSDKEFVLIAKTINEKKEQVIKEVKDIHSYTIPCILSFEVEANPEFMEWVNEQFE